MTEGVTTLEETLNADTTLKIELPRTEDTNDFVLNIATGWKVSGVNGPQDKTEYRVTFTAKTVIGVTPFLEVTAQPIFQTTLRGARLYDDYSDSEHSLTNVLDKAFSGTGFTYRIVGSYDNSGDTYIESFGNGMSKLELFQQALETWKLEFYVNGSQVELHNYVKRTPAYYISDEINAKNVKVEEDGTNFYTYGRAYYDINDGEPLKSAGGWREYKHPLYNTLGRSDAPVMLVTNTDEDIDVAKIEKSLKAYIDNSLKVSITADFISLKEEWPEAEARLADEIELISTKLETSMTVRLVSITTKRNHFGEIIEQTVTFGDLPLGERHASNLTFAAQYIEDLDAGRKTLPRSVLDQATQLATQLLLNANTELDFTKTRGIIARDPSNPLNLVMYNSQGLGISDDGGVTFKSAITGAGIVADVITAGVLNVNNVILMSDTGNLIINGDKITSVDPNNPKKKVEISPGQINVWGGGINLYRPDGYPVLRDGLIQFGLGVWRYWPQFSGPDVTVDGVFFKTKSATPQTFDAFAVKHDSRYLKIELECRMAGTETVSGGLYFQEFGPNSTGLYQSSLIRTTTPQSVKFTIDLGVPTGQLKYFYLQFKTGNEAYSVMAREIIIYTEG